VQVTINCAERGLLLLRVRDEIRMTIAAYQTLCVPFRRVHLNVAKKCFGATADDAVVWRVMLLSEMYGQRLLLVSVVLMVFSGVLCSWYSVRCTALEQADGPHEPYHIYIKTLNPIYKYMMMMMMMMIIMIIIV
jgi:hypothetical protein